jgi:hypothetical protein
MSIHYTNSGDLGITDGGWMIRRSVIGWIVVDDNNTFVGVFTSQVEAEAATVPAWTPEVTA